MVDYTVNQISNPDLEVESLGCDIGERQTVGKMLKLKKLYCILQNEQSEANKIRSQQNSDTSLGPSKIAFCMQ